MKIVVINPIKKNIRKGFLLVFMYLVSTLILEKQKLSKVSNKY